MIGAPKAGEFVRARAKKSGWSSKEEACGAWYGVQGLREHKRASVRGVELLAASAQDADADTHVHVPICICLLLRPARPRRRSFAADRRGASLALPRPKPRRGDAGTSYRANPPASSSSVVSRVPPSDTSRGPRFLDTSSPAAPKRQARCRRPLSRRVPAAVTPPSPRLPTALPPGRNSPRGRDEPRRGFPPPAVARATRNLPAFSPRGPRPRRNDVAASRSPVCGRGGGHPWPRPAPGRGCRHRRGGHRGVLVRQRRRRADACRSPSCALVLSPPPPLTVASDRLPARGEGASCRDCRPQQRRRLFPAARGSPRPTSLLPWRGAEEKEGVPVLVLLFLRAMALQKRRPRRTPHRAFVKLPRPAVPAAAAGGRVARVPDGFRRGPSPRPARAAPHGSTAALSPSALRRRAGAAVAVAARRALAPPTWGLGTSAALCSALRCARARRSPLFALRSPLLALGSRGQTGRHYGSPGNEEKKLLS